MNDMTAAFLTGPSRLELRRTAVPKAGAGEALLRVRAAGLCGSDARVFRQGSPRLKYPGIPGHEIAGDIVALGAGTRRWRVGDRVAVGSLVPCGKCPLCRASLENHCARGEALGFQRSGGLAEYVVLPGALLSHGHAARIPPHMPYDLAAMAEPLATVLNGIERMGGASGQSVAVLGSGSAAGMAALACRALGARPVALAGRSRSLAKGVVGRRARVVPYGGFESTRKALLRESGSGGFDRVFVASDSADMQTMAVSLLAPRGCAVLFGVAPRGEMTRINANDLHYGESSLVGAFGAGRRHFESAVRLLAKRPAEFRALITHRFPLSQVHTAYGAMADRRRTKIVVHPSGEKGPI